jgi:hypothetical protein
MNLENLKNIGGHIETEDSKEKQEILFEKIEQIALVYADHKFKEKKDGDSYKFSDAVKEFTPIKNIILRLTFHLEGFSPDDYKEKIDLFLKDFYEEVDRVYEISGFDLDLISSLINSKKDSIKNYLGVADLREFAATEEESKTKVLNFNEITNIEQDAEKKYKNLENLGFSKFDHFVEVHVKDFYNTGEKNLGPELIKNDLALVAEYIIDKEPEAVAIIGKSWLLNTPVADLLGFKRIEDEATEQNDFSTWLQFIDKNGQIDQKRFNAFLKTGEPPFKSTKAYMPTEEFLQKYLPENRRGKIMLKEINMERKDFWERVMAEAQAIKIGWDNLLKTNGDFENFIGNNKALNELFDFVSPEHKSEYLSFFKKMYDQKIFWSEFHNYKSENVKKVDEKINEDMKADLYKEREIFVEALRP